MSRQIQFALPRLEIGFAAYQEIRHAIANSLGRSGARVRQVSQPADVTPEDDVLLLIGSPAFYPGLTDALAAVRARADISPLVFLWHLEHLPDLSTPAPLLWAQLARAHVLARRNGGRYGNSRAANYWTIRQAVERGLIDQVFVFTRRKTEFLNRMGTPAEFLPLGHHPCWGEETAAERDIDVLFLGEVRDDRRGRIVRAVTEALGREGVILKTMYDFNPVGLWGAERNALINRAKIFLSVYRHPADSSGMRFSLGMGNGALVVSEPIADPHPFRPGEHYIEAPVRELPAVILSYLRDEEARQRLCRSASIFLREHCSLRVSAARLIEHARAAGLRP